MIQAAAISAVFITTASSAIGGSGFAWEYHPSRPGASSIFLRGLTLDEHLSVTTGCPTIGERYVYFEAGTVGATELILEAGAGSIVPVQIMGAGQTKQFEPVVGLSGVGSALLNFSDAESAEMTSFMLELTDAMTIKLFGYTFTIGMHNFKDEWAKYDAGCPTRADS